MKQLLVIVVLAILVTPIFNASEIPETACPIIYDFSNVEVGNGGQDYVSNVHFKVNPDVEPGPFNIDLYDWLGNYIESAYFDSDEDYSVLTGTDEPPVFTGLVDGTYTFIVNDTYKGTFNVNHETQGLFSIDMSKYNQCNHDAYGSYIDPNTINYYDENGNYILTNNTDSKAETLEVSEVSNERVSGQETRNINLKFILLISVLISLLLVIISVLIVVIYKLKKNKL